MDKFDSSQSSGGISAIPQQENNFTFPSHLHKLSYVISRDNALLIPFVVIHAPADNVSVRQQYQSMTDHTKN
ncbi:MAG: hypothetical protein WBL68_16030 [Nitrososphaeraceae archaeon]